MKVGDLVMFKHEGYHKSYGPGIILEPTVDRLANDTHDTRYWALFNAERLVVRLEELKVINESR